MRFHHQDSPSGATRKVTKGTFKMNEMLKKQNPEFSRRPWCLGALVVNMILAGTVFAQTPVAGQDAKIAQAARQVQTAQDEVQKLKDAWDRSRLESTLYGQRAQRAYKRWAAAKKDWKKKMAQHKDEAQLEFELAVEKRKLAFDLWQQAQYRLGAEQQLLNAAESTVDIQATQAHIAKLQSQMTPALGASATSSPVAPAL
jgi:hypothetical protein